MAAPTVVLADESTASGMATMVADLLTSNVRDFRTRRSMASVARGSVVFTTSDRDISVTVTFGPGSIEVSDGVDPTSPVVAAPWLVMAGVCSGSTSPFSAWRLGQLQVQHVMRGPLAAAATWVLSVPKSFYDEADAVPQPSTSGRTRALIVGVSLSAASAAVAVIVAMVGRSRRNSFTASPMTSDAESR